MKKFRKFLSIVLVMVSILALFAQSAFAETGFSEKLNHEIEKTNTYIYKAIAKAQEEAEREALKDNKSQEEFGEYLDKLIEKLVEKTEKRADKLIEKALREGVILEKEYEEHVIGGRIVEIDPFYAH